MDTNILAESQNYILSKDYERVFLKSKSKGEIIFSDSQYGEANSGIISPNEDWCVVGGEGVLLWNLNDGLTYFLRSDPMFIHAIKQIDTKSVKILVDPWSESASVWVLDTSKKTIIKEKDGPYLEGEPYVENVPF